MINNHLPATYGRLSHTGLGDLRCHGERRAGGWEDMRRRVSENRGRVSVGFLESERSIELSRSRAPGTLPAGGSPRVKRALKQPCRPQPPGGPAGGSPRVRRALRQPCRLRTPGDPALRLEGCLREVSPSAPDGHAPLVTGQRKRNKAAHLLCVCARAFVCTIACATQRARVRLCGARNGMPKHVP